MAIEMNARGARGLAAAVAIVALAGAGGAAAPAPTVATVKLTASSDVNPASGHGAPVVVRVYQLTSAAAFEKAEFFPLLNADAAALGPDLVKKDEYLLAPGATKETTLTVPDRVQAIGIFAAYREFQTKTWRATAAVPANKTTAFAVSLGSGGVSIAAGK